MLAPEAAEARSPVVGEVAMDGAEEPAAEQDLPPGQEDSPSKRRCLSKQEEGALDSHLEATFGVVDPLPCALESKWAAALDEASAQEKATVVERGNNPLTAAVFVRLQEIQRVRSDVAAERQAYSISQAFQLPGPGGAAP